MTRKTVPEIRAAKKQAPLVVLTAYTVPVARALDTHCDILLVGDSLGMVLYGMPTTLSVSLDTMIAHGKAVASASSQALVVVDMPFASYQESKEQAFRNCARVLSETGASAIKLEGGAEMAETIAFLTERAIPVMGHVGMMPQHIHRMGGFKKQGADKATRARILADAAAVDKAGAFAMVVEHVDDALATEITKKVSIPTIGIGASKNCDGQVLVSEDMSGLNAATPPFVKRYAEMGEVLSKAAKAYAAEVRARKFPKK